jgi:transcriptional regulator with XRE-family HTH domain
MSRKKKTAVQQALIAMRKKFNLTQQQLAKAMKVTLVTVSRWESSRSPTGASLAQLAAFAQQAGDVESAGLFHESAQRGNLNLEEWELQQAAEAPMKALRQIQAAVDRDYSYLLSYALFIEHLSKTHESLIRSVIDDMVDTNSPGNLMELAAVQKYLRKEMERINEKREKA